MTPEAQTILAQKRIVTSIEASALDGLVVLRVGVRDRKTGIVFEFGEKYPASSPKGKHLLDLYGDGVYNNAE